MKELLPTKEELLLSIETLNKVIYIYRTLACDGENSEDFIANAEAVKIVKDTIEVINILVRQS